MKPLTYLQFVISMLFFFSLMSTSFASVPLPVCESSAKTFTMNDSLYIVITNQIDECGLENDSVYFLNHTNTNFSLSEKEDLLLYSKLSYCSLTSADEMVCSEDSYYTLIAQNQTLTEADNDLTLERLSANCKDILECENVFKTSLIDRFGMKEKVYSFIKSNILIFLIIALSIIAIIFFFFYTLYKAIKTFIRIILGIIIVIFIYLLFTDPGIFLTFFSF